MPETGAALIDVVIGPVSKHTDRTTDRFLHISDYHRHLAGHAGALWHCSRAASTPVTSRNVIIIIIPKDRYSTHLEERNVGQKC